MSVTCSWWLALTSLICALADVLLCDGGYTGRYCELCSTNHFRSSNGTGDGSPPLIRTDPTHQSGLECSLCPVGSVSPAGQLNDYTVCSEWLLLMHYSRCCYCCLVDSAANSAAGHAPSGCMHSVNIIASPPGLQSHPPVTMSALRMMLSCSVRQPAHTLRAAAARSSPSAVEKE